jgi:16S rRNA (guanine527-N7)-methyltransferase
MSTKLDKRNVSRETLQAARDLYEDYSGLFESYLDQLLWWNKRVNLVSRNVSRETLQEHVIHSLIPLRLGLIGSNSKWVDAGSGGGLPGIPLAIAAPQTEWVVNDISRKKMTAVNQIVIKLGLKNVMVEPGDIGDYEFGEEIGVVSKHAFSVVDLFERIRAQPWKKLIMYKGDLESEKEVNELNVPVRCIIYTFDFGGSETFYEGKGILFIER